MKHSGPSKTGAHRRQVPSHDPMPGADDDPIDTGATSGAQLPSDQETARPEDDAKNKDALNPNQGDLLSPFWPRK